jgi:hypothetical protein
MELTLMTRDRVDGYNEDRGINDQGHLGSLSHSKPDEGKGYERDRRNETKELDVGVEHSPDKADVPHQETQRDAQPTTDGPSGQDPEEADLDVPNNDPSFTISTKTPETSHGEGKKRGVVREARANQTRKKRKRESA